MGCNSLFSLHYLIFLCRLHQEAWGNSHIFQEGWNSRISIMNCWRYKLKRNFNLLNTLKNILRMRWASYWNFLLLWFSNKMGWVHPTPLTLYTTIESLQSLNSQKGPPFRLIHICLLPPGCGAWHLACVRVYFQYQGSMQKPMYMMTCTYTFWWHHIYVHLPILSGKYILGHQGPNISFQNNFTKKYFFSKLRVVSDSARQYLSK